jgi:AcrR family transcriptional regulator
MTVMIDTNRPKLGTKELILDVSLKLFSTKGYKSTSVRDIASDVGITQSGLYNHFKGKEAILEALISDLMSSAIVKIFENRSIEELALTGKSLLFSIATTFKLISFDKKNEALFKFLMQELYKNHTIRDIYNEHFYQGNVKKLSSVFFIMMQQEKIKAADPLFLAHEFFAPLFFYQMQVNLHKIDGKSTSSMVTLFEKHVDFFWENNKIAKQETLF